MANLVVIIVVLVFDVTAFALAIAAENHRSTATVETVTESRRRFDYCVYDSSVATGYGVGALLLLMASQVMIMIGSKCFCCGRGLRPGRFRAYSGICFLACWFTFVITELCLLAGSVRNAYHTRYHTLLKNGPPDCQALRKGVFGAGAAFVFFTALFTELHYIFHGKAKDNTTVPPLVKDPAIGMTQF